MVGRRSLLFIPKVINRFSSNLICHAGASFFKKSNREPAVLNLENNGVSCFALRNALLNSL